VVKKIIITTIFLSIIINPVLAYDVPLPPEKVYELPSEIQSSRYNFSVRELFTVNPSKEKSLDHSLIMAQNSKYVLAVTRETNQIYYSELGPDIKFKSIGKLLSEDWLNKNFPGSAISIKSTNLYGSKLYITVVQTENPKRKCAHSLFLLSVDISNLVLGIEPTLNDYNILFQGDCDRASRGLWGGALAVDSSGIYLALGENRYDWKTGKQISQFYTKDELVLKNTFNGKILFFDATNRTINKKPRIFASGFRNPYGLEFIKFGGRKVLAITDIGPEGGDELNIVKKGVDYGWPKFSLGRQYDLNNPSVKTEEGYSWGNFGKSSGAPIWSWVPSSVPTQFFQVPINTSLSDWSENLIIATLSGTLERLVVFNSAVIAKESIKFPTRVRNIALIKNDIMLVSTDDGRIYSLAWDILKD